MKVRQWQCLGALAVVLFCVAPVAAAAEVHVADADEDALSDADELRYGTDPNNPDTDGDGYFDGLEVAQGYSPHAGNRARIYESDVDGDGLDDWVEVWFGSSVTVADTDADSATDREALLQGRDPSGSGKIYQRRIEIDRTKQRIYMYVDDIKVLNFPVSTGNPWTPTPEGVYSVQRKVPIKPYIGEDYYYPNVRWNLQFIPMYYIHESYWHNGFGLRTRSHGCVNMRGEDAEVLYTYATVGMPVHVTGETPPNVWVEA